jgi:hypothetical protein
MTFWSILGHLVKSWKRRYMVLNGDTLELAYYDSKDGLYKENHKAKGSFILSEVEKVDFSSEGVHIKPYGIKFVGHAPGKGFKECDVYLENQLDQTKWLEVAHNALGKNAAPHKSFDERAELVLGTKTTR